MSVAAKAGSTPRMAQISSSPVMPPMGMAPTTMLSSTDRRMTRAAATAAFSGMMSKKYKVNSTLATEVTTEPSLWRLVPRGITPSATFSLTPSLRAAERFTGRQAADDEVPTAVADGGIISFQNLPRGMRQKRAQRE